MTDTNQSNSETPYIYHTPSSSYNYPNKPYEPFPQEKPKKLKNEHRYKLIGVVTLGIVLVFLGLFLSYKYIPSVQRFIIMNFNGTDKYYLYIENDNLKETISSLSQILEESCIAAKNLPDASVPLKGSIDLNIDSGLLKQAGKPMHLGLSFTYDTKKDLSHTSWKLFSEGTDLLAFDYLQNTKNKYLLFPQLGQQYIDITKLLSVFISNTEDFNVTGDPSSSSMTSSYLNNQELFINLFRTLDKGMLCNLLDRYGNSLLDGLSQYSTIDLVKGVNLDLSQYIPDEDDKSKALTLFCDEFTISITEQDALTILQNLIELLKNDKELMQLVEASGVDSFYFKAAIAYISVELQSQKSSNKEPLVKMKVYTHKNDIVFRQIDFGKEAAYQLILSSYESGDYHFLYTHFQNKGNSSEDLSLCITYNLGKLGAYGVGYATIFDDTLFIKINNLSYKGNKYSALPIGALTIMVEDSSTASGWSDTVITYEGTQEKDTQKASILFNNKTRNLINLNFIFEPYESDGFLMPGENATIISSMDRMQMKQYLENSSIQSVLDSFNSQFSITIDKEDLILSFLTFLDQNVYSLKSKGENNE